MIALKPFVFTAVLLGTGAFLTSVHADSDAKPAPGQQVLQHFPYKKADGAEAQLAYWLYLPPASTATKKEPEPKLPLLLFLHGSGERGTNADLVKKHGPPKMAGKSQELESFIVVSPQCPPEQWWDLKVLKQLCDSLLKALPVDEDRVCLTGLSMGGFATWGLLAEHPGYWAAAIPICGGGDPRQAAKFKAVPLWVFHGETDQAVPLKASQEMVAALKAAGTEPKFTVYPKVGHECWGLAYDNPATWAWLREQKRSPAPK